MAIPTPPPQSVAVHEEATRSLPPFWLPVLAGLPLAACLLLIALPNLEYGAAMATRTAHLSALVLWLLPLTWLQRALWRRELAPWAMAGLLLVATYAMALSVRLAAMVVAALAAGRTPAPTFDESLLLRGLEGPWLALIAYCALHAMVIYYTQFRDEQLRRVQAQALAREAELMALRYQLHPHFLFNTLNAISSLMADGRGRQAQQMLARLGEFLRATLDGARGHEVCLADELSLTEAYLDIEKARLGERLQLQWQFGPDVLDARFPYLLFQPLVENAIRHGIAPRSEPGRLDLRVQALEGQLQVEVVNDLPKTSLPSGTDAGTGLGLRNVRERLDKLYPGAYTLQAARDDDGRYRVRLRLPLRLGADGAPA
ncbi:sensor histidine kinase [Lysobacter silvisoli]|uniref:Sensor histidine kinase n=1 Tax=Lysobacter silvisoli TaxID=2293254 RepID=A0A371K065_9GAMM|nr:histidine kinase [Lysobacter silvisoli]RDZ27260.1 sensor histidine kinase [Lysobacter silvisoli]